MRFRACRLIRQVSIPVSDEGGQVGRRRGRCRPSRQAVVGKSSQRAAARLPAPGGVREGGIGITGRSRSRGDVHDDEPPLGDRVGRPRVDLPQGVGDQPLVIGATLDDPLKLDGRTDVGATEERRRTHENRGDETVDMRNRTGSGRCNAVVSAVRESTSNSRPCPILRPVRASNSRPSRLIFRDLNTRTQPAAETSRRGSGPPRRRFVRRRWRRQGERGSFPVQVHP